MGKKKTLDFYIVDKKLCKKVERLAKTLNIKQIAISIGWSKETFYQKMAKHPDLVDAIARGQAKGVKEITNSLYKTAKGFSYKEVHEETFMSRDGKATKKTKTIKKRVLPSVQAQMDYLTNRDPENWKRRQEHDLKGGLYVDLKNVKKEDVEKVEKLFEDITDE